MRNSDRMSIGDERDFDEGPVAVRDLSEALFNGGGKENPGSRGLAAETGAAPSGIFGGCREMRPWKHRRKRLA